MTTSPAPGGWQDDIRGRLLARGAVGNWPDLWPEVVAARLTLLDTIAPISETQAAWKPAPEDWSIAETIRHLLPSSAGVITIIQALTAGDDPAADTQYDSPGEVVAHEVAPAFEGSFAALRDALRHDSITFAALPARLRLDPDLVRTFSHMYFGALPARAWFAFQRVHDRAHLRQIEEITSANGFPS